LAALQAPVQASGGQEQAQPVRGLLLQPIAVEPNLAAVIIIQEQVDEGGALERDLS
jgi:hypothetical protein